MLALPWPVLRAIEENAVIMEDPMPGEDLNETVSGTETDTRENDTTEANALETGAPATGSQITKEIVLPPADDGNTFDAAETSDAEESEIPDAEESEIPVPDAAEIPALDAADLTTDENNQDTVAEPGTEDELTGDELPEMDAMPDGMLTKDAAVLAESNPGIYTKTDDNIYHRVEGDKILQTNKAGDIVIYVPQGAVYTVERENSGALYCWWQWDTPPEDERIEVLIANKGLLPYNKKWIGGNEVDTYQHNHAKVSVRADAAAGENAVLQSAKGPGHGLEKHCVTMYVIAPITVTYRMNDGTENPVVFDQEGQHGFGITEGYTTGTEGTSQRMTVSTVRPSREGYAFLGWNTDPDAGVADPKYEAGQTFQTTGNLTLYAQWKPLEGSYTVQYYKDNAAGEPELTDTDPESQPGKTGDVISYQTDKYPNYTVRQAVQVIEEGREVPIDPAVPGSDRLMITSEGGEVVIKVYYKRDEKDYTVHYHLEDPDCPENDRTYTEAAGEPVTGSGKFGTQIDLSRYTQKEFAGFLYEKTECNSEDEAGNPVISEDGTARIDIYYKRLSYPAHWIVRISDRPEDHSLDRTEEYRYEAKITPPEITAPFGYVWSGWPGDVPETMPALAAGETLTFTATLEKTVGDLVIAKEQDAGGATAVYTIHSEDGNYTKEVMLTGGGSVTVKGLPAGNYTVREQSWSWNGTQENRVEVKKNESATTAFRAGGTNTSWLFGEAVSRLLSGVTAGSD